MTRKQFWAWLLLVAVSIQWVGGVVYVRLNYTSWIELEMNEAEANLAATIAQEYGVKATVKILDEADQKSPLHAGYGAPFIFSHDNADDDSTDYFTVETDQPEMVTHEYLANGPERSDETGKALLSLNQLFSPYIINIASPVKPIVISRISSGNFVYQNLQDLFHLQIPTPPPSLFS